MCQGTCECDIRGLLCICRFRSEQGVLQGLYKFWFETPRGKKDVYFDTGTLINTPGEVARQESARAQYMGRMAPTLKVQ